MIMYNVTHFTDTKHIREQKYTKLKQYAIFVNVDMPH